MKNGAVETVEAILRAEVDAVVKSTDFTTFGDVIAERIAAELLVAPHADPLLSPLVSRELADAVSMREVSFPAFHVEVMARIRATTTGEALGALGLAEEVRREVDAVDFSSFSQKVTEHVEALASENVLPARVSHAIASSLHEALEHAGLEALPSVVLERIAALPDREVTFSPSIAGALAEFSRAGTLDQDLVAPVIARISELVERDRLPDALARALRAEHLRVPDAPRASRSSTSDAPLADAAVSEANLPVQAHRAPRAPLRRLEGEREAGDARIRPPRVSAWLGALAGLAAAAAVAIWSSAPPPAEAPIANPIASRGLPVIASPSGVVSVEDVAFEGTVTVLADEGVAVLWIADS